MVYDESSWQVLVYSMSQKSSTPPKTFFSIFGQVNYYHEMLPVYYQFISTNIYQFWSIYLNI